MSSFSSRQQAALAVLPKITGTISMSGSCLILSDILSDPKKRRPMTAYSKIMTAMSLFDLCSGIGYFLSTWPLPKDSGVIWASGNQATCNFQGFMFQLSVANSLLNTTLSLYYLLVVGFQWKNSQLKQYFERPVLILMPLFVFGTAIASLALTLFNPAGLWCWIASLPSDCSATRDSSGNCQRGQNAWIYRWAFYYAPLWFCILAATVFMILLVCYVSKTEAKSNARRLSHPASTILRSHDTAITSTTKATTTNSTSATTASATKASSFRIIMNSTKQQNISSTTGTTSRVNNQATTSNNPPSLTNKVVWQATYYLLVFYVTWTFITILRLLQTIGKDVPFFVTLMVVIMTPLQGFWNCLVYFKPRFEKYYRQQRQQMAGCQQTTNNSSITNNGSSSNATNNAAADATTNTAIHNDSVGGIIFKTIFRGRRVSRRRSQLVQQQLDAALTSAAFRTLVLDEDKEAEADKEEMDPAYAYIKQRHGSLLYEEDRPCASQGDNEDDYDDDNDNQATNQVDVVDESGEIIDA